MHTPLTHMHTHMYRHVNTHAFTERHPPALRSPAPASTHTSVSQYTCTQIHVHTDTRAKCACERTCPDVNMPPRPLGNGSMYVMGRRESPGLAQLLSVIRAFCFGRAGWAELHSLAVNEQNLHHHPCKAGPPATTQLGRGPGPYISPHASTMSASGGWALLPPWCNGTSKAGPLPGSSFPAPTAGDRNLVQESPARAQLPSVLSLQLHHAWLGPSAIRVSYPGSTQEPVLPFLAPRKPHSPSQKPHE